MLGMVLGAESSTVNKTDKNPSPLVRLIFSWGETGKKIIKKISKFYSIVGNYILCGKIK